MSTGRRPAPGWRAGWLEIQGDRCVGYRRAPAMALRPEAGLKAPTCQPRTPRGSSQGREEQLAGFKAWILYLRGRSNEAEAYAKLALTTRSAATPVALRGTLLAFQAFLAINRGNPKQAVPIAKGGSVELRRGSILLPCLRPQLARARTAPVRRSGHGQLDTASGRRAGPPARQRDDNAGCPRRTDVVNVRTGAVARSHAPVRRSHRGVRRWAGPAAAGCRPGVRVTGRSALRPCRDVP
jgi:hypothetical protein